MGSIESKQALESGTAFTKIKGGTSKIESAVNPGVKYDLIGKIVEETGLTRKTAVTIFKGIEKVVFNQFKKNPEEFIIKAFNIINEQKASVIIEHIIYNKLEDCYTTNVFTETTLKGKLGVNAIRTKKHIFDHLVYDSKIERDLAETMDKQDEIAVYIKLPSSFYINTPVGKYNPDWAIAFDEGKVKHIYFVAETKGDLASLQLRKVEELKIRCAKEHFRKISNDTVKYIVADNYEKLLNEVMR